MAETTVTTNGKGGKGYARKLQEVLDPVNQLLDEAARKGIGFELYMRTFPGGDSASYGAPTDRSGGESASAQCVSVLEIGDVNTINPQSGLTVTEQPEPLSLAAREVLYQKLQFMAGTVGGIANRQDEPSTDECIAMMIILYEIADQIFPERKEQEQGQ